MTSSSFRNRPSARLLTFVVFAVGAVGAGCGSSARVTGDDGGGGGNASDSGVGAGGAGQAGSGGSGTGGEKADGSTSLPACPGVEPTPPSQACRTAADCPQTFATCGPTYQAAGCGVCLPAPHECSGDGGCSPEKVCVPATGPCQCNVAGGPGMVCTLRCTPTSCAAGQGCDTASGLCKPMPCGPDFACGSGLICAPMRAGADVHGCAIAACATDGYTCPSGYACTPAADADANGCSPVSCVGGGFRCPPNTDCKVGSTSPHNCERRTCISDKNCDCGACIGGGCKDKLYVCSPSPAA